MGSYGMTIKHVKGSRSPRWALWSKMMIPCTDGIPYLFRIRVIQTSWFGIYLHDIYEPDTDRHPHNHPWTFYSIILRGNYKEKLYPYPLNRPPIYKEQTWKRWSIHKMNMESAHRIVDASPGLKTLILTGPRSKKGWGFFTKNGWMHWKDYEKKYQLPKVQNEE